MPALVSVGGGFALPHFLCLPRGELFCLLGDLEILWGLFGRADGISLSSVCLGWCCEAPLEGMLEDVSVLPGTDPALLTK